MLAQRVEFCEAALDRVVQARASRGRALRIQLWGGTSTGTAFARGGAEQVQRQSCALRLQRSWSWDGPGCRVRRG